MRLKFFGILLLLSTPDFALAQKLQIDLDLIKLTVEQWSEAHNTKDKDVFKKLYAPTVLFYTKELPQSECIQIKFDRLNSGKSFSQKIITDLTNTFYQSGITKCEFTKEVKSGSKIRQYKSYLLLEVKDNAYQIVGESDLQTDAKLKYTLELGPKYKVEELEMVSFAETDTSESIASSKNLRKVLSILMWVLLIIAFILALYLIYDKFKERKSGKRANFMYNRQNASSGVRTVTQRHVYSAQRRFSRRSSKKNPDKSFGNSSVREINDSSNEVIKKKGNDFEGFIFERFDRQYFTIRYWNGDFSHKGYYPESNTYPDLEIEFKYEDFKRTFAVECKYRAKLYNDNFEIESHKLDNYRKYSREKQIDVYIALGLSGEASNPDELYLIPLRYFDGRNSIPFYELENFRRRRNNLFYDMRLDMLT